MSKWSPLAPFSWVRQVELGSALQHRAWDRIHGAGFPNVAHDRPYSKILSLLTQGRETEAQLHGPPAGSTHWAPRPQTGIKSPCVHTVHVPAAVCRQGVDEAKFPPQPFLIRSEFNSWVKISPVLSEQTACWSLARTMSYHILK